MVVALEEVLSASLASDPLVWEFLGSANSWVGVIILRPRRPTARRTVRTESVIMEPVFVRSVLWMFVHFRVHY